MIKNGWVDVVVDYTGTGCLFFNVDFLEKKRERKSEMEIIEKIREAGEERFQCEWFDPLKSKTNYCLVIKEDLDEKKKRKIKTISDLSTLQTKNKPVRLAADNEFVKRRDGFLGLDICYKDVNFEPVICSFKDRYEFLENGEADVGLGHTPDSEIETFELRVLDDDKVFFPNYSEVPIARQEALNSVEGLKTSLEEFSKLGFDEDHLKRLIKSYNLNYDLNRSKFDDTVKEVLSDLMEKRSQKKKVKSPQPPS